MKSAFRLVTSFVVALTALLVVSSEAVAQSSVPTATAQAFVGNWSLPITGDQPAEFLISLSDNGGNLAGTVSIVGMGEAAPIKTISKAGDDLVLAYDLDFGGQGAPVTIKLTPVSATSLTGAIDIADGMFSTSGTATKK